MPHLDRIDLRRCRAPAEACDVLLARAGRLRWLGLGGASVAGAEDEHGQPLSGMPRYRQGFREAGVRVNWSSEFLGPHNGGSWKGHSWEGLRQRHLSTMNRFLSAGDHDGLESAYREDCRKHAGDEAAAEAAALPFGQYEASLHAGLEWAAAEAELRGAAAVVLRLRYDETRPWASEFHLDPNPPKGREPFADFGPREPLARWPVPGFPAARELLLNRGARNGPLDPNALEHYL